MEQEVRRPGFTVVLVFAFVLALGTAAFDFYLQQSQTHTRDASVATDDAIGSAMVAIADFRAAETAYLATGQAPDFWMRRATELADGIDAGIARMRSSSSGTTAQARYETAAGALADLAGLDKRARTDIQNDQRFLASDLIFVDGLDATQRLTGALAEARTAERADASSKLTLLSGIRLAGNALALVVLGGLAVLLVRPAQKGPTSAASEVAQMIRDLPPPVKPAGATNGNGRPVPVAVPINLADAADLCVDLARVIDDRDVPALLERAAKVLEAKGVIVWLADKAGTTLRPALAHGYSERVLVRLDSLEAGADNVTSLSYRSIRCQSMNGTAPGAPGAIAVPLVTASGCAGVLSAEVRDSKPTAEMIALAKIIAAQFATLIAPDAGQDARATAQA